MPTIYPFTAIVGQMRMRRALPGVERRGSPDRRGADSR
jgi:hypothetical protein